LTSGLYSMMRSGLRGSADNVAEAAVEDIFFFFVGGRCLMSAGGDGEREGE
jgi:hypothetical protein